MKYKTILIIGKGRSLENINKINKNVDLIIICNQLWSSELYKFENEYYNHPEIYKFLKKNKSTLFIRNLSDNSNIKSSKEFTEKFEIVDKFVTNFKDSIKKKYKQERNNKIINKSRFMEENRVNTMKEYGFDIFPEIVYPAVLSEIKLIESNKNLYGYLDTISWCIDLAILYYQAENVYFCGIDMYEEGFIYKNLYNWSITPQLIEQKKCTFFNKLKNYNNINFEIFSYNKFKNMIIPVNCKLFNLI